MQQNLVDVIRNSLNAAFAALQLAETTATPAVVPAARQSQRADSAPVADVYGTLIRELNDERFKLRSVDELASIAGISPACVYDELDAHGADYVRRTRRSDGATLVGLYCRQ